MKKENLQKIFQDPEFQNLMKKVSFVSLSFTVAMMLVYYLFILLLAYGKDLLSKPLTDGSATTLGIPIGIGVILSAWILTGLYVYWANKNYDPMVKKLREKFYRYSFFPLFYWSHFRNNILGCKKVKNSNRVLCCRQIRFRISKRSCVGR